MHSIDDAGSTMTKMAGNIIHVVFHGIRLIITNMDWCTTHFNSIYHISLGRFLLYLQFTLYYNVFTRSKQKMTDDNDEDDDNLRNHSDNTR